MMGIGYADQSRGNRMRGAGAVIRIEQSVIDIPVNVDFSAQRLVVPFAISGMYYRQVAAIVAQSHEQS